MAAPPPRDGVAYLSIGVPIASPVVSPRESSRESDYFYTLVFPNTKAREDDDDDNNDAEITGARDRISYADALATLRAVTAGGKEREKQVVDEFRGAWMAKFRTPAPAPRDSIPLVYFQELVRELIVQRFDAIPELFLKTSLSQDQRSLLIRFRPSKALLCATADRLQMKVAVMAEVDPGEAYWAADPTRAANEAYQWSRADAQEELYRMFLAGKISTEEAQLYDDEDAAMWSRRIHALRRFFDPDVATAISAAAMQQETTAAYVSFKNRPSLRYLYRQIDGARDDATPFRVVDKIRLTKAIVDAEFDCDALVETRLLAHHLCTHTHHTDAVDTSIDVLRAQWGALAGPARLAQLLYAQPVAHIRNYFGEELALYCAYTSFYAQSLQLLCVAAVAAWLLHSSSSFSGVASDGFYIAFAVINTASTQAFVRKWDIREREHAAQWGVAALRDEQVARPQFRGELAVSPITHRVETFYSPQRRQLRQLASAALLLGVDGGLLVADFAVLTSSAYGDAVAASSVLVLHVGVAAVAKLLTAPFAALAKSLTEWENYKTQQDHDFHLTIKFAVLQTVNLFGVLWLQTFALPFVLADQPTQTPADCQQRAAHLLMTLLAVDLAVSLWDLRAAVASGMVACVVQRSRWLRPANAASDSGDRARLLGAESPPPTPPSSPLDDELALEPYEGVMFDYAQVIMPFGFVSWFAALAPLATLLAAGVAVLQIRVDAFKLCALTQRPFPAQKNSVGSWAAYLRFLAVGAWLHNAMLTTLFLSSASPAAFHDLTAFVSLQDTTAGSAAESEGLATELRLLVVFAGFCCVASVASVHDQRDRARLKRLRWRCLRQQFLENKYVNNLDRLSDSIRDALPSGRVFLNGVHLYVVTGNKAEEDAAEEILDELVQLQLRSLQLQKQIAELRAADAAVGTLVVEVGSINILPVMDALTKAVDSFLQLQLTRAAGDAASGGATPSAATAKPANTSVVKKNRSPQWTESFELTLASLDDALLVRVYDWELLGKNRRIGHATLHVADVVATAPPLQLTARGSIFAPGGGLLLLGGDVTSEASPVAAASPRVRMATFDVPIEMPELLVRTMHADLIKHGHPKLSLRCGVRLDALGRLLLHQSKLQTKIRHLNDREKQFFQWK